MVKKGSVQKNPLMYCTWESMVTDDRRQTTDNNGQHTLNLSYYLMCQRFGKLKFLESTLELLQQFKLQIRDSLIISFWFHMVVGLWPGHVWVPQTLLYVHHKTGIWMVGGQFQTIPLGRNSHRQMSTMRVWEWDIKTPKLAAQTWVTCFNYIIQSRPSRMFWAVLTLHPCWQTR